MSSSSDMAWLTRTGGSTAAASLGIDWMQVGLATALCLALGIAAIVVLRKHVYSRFATGAPAARRIRIIEHARLTPRDTLHLVEYDQRVVMLVSNASGVTLLDAHDRDARES